MGATRLKTVKAFINLKLASDQININANSEVTFVEESADGLSVSSNRVTLKAGTTYVLSCDLRHVGSATSTSGTYIWRDYTNSVNLGIGLLVNSQDDPTDDGVQPAAVVIVKPTTDIDVGVRCTFVNAANQKLAADATQASIYSI